MSWTYWQVFHKILGGDDTSRTQCGPGRRRYRSTASREGNRDHQLPDRSNQRLSGKSAVLRARASGEADRGWIPDRQLHSRRWHHHGKVGESCQGDQLWAPARPDADFVVFTEGLDGIYLHSYNYHFEPSRQITIRQ